MSLLWFLLLLTDISGTINEYTKVLQVSQRTNRVVVADASAFAWGDTVLLVQVGGATIDTNRDARYGTLRAYGSAGEFERNVIDSIVGTTIYLHRNMLYAYDATDRLQLVRMPSYTTARVVAELTCPSWDGATGGVLAFSASDTLFLNADIRVDGKGLAGGTWNANGSFVYSSPGPPTPRQYATNDSTCCFSSRGESIAASPYALGFAHASNGGGGGASEYHGGGGGAHVGCGGDGADAKWWWGNRDNGIGGTELSYRTFVNRIFMGGGGGATEIRDLSSVVGDGGNGGGIIIIEAPVIVGDGAHVISSTGDLGTTGWRSGSGGGAGGALLLVTEQFINVPRLIVKGGNGGPSGLKSSKNKNCGGPGGGGGGGAILLGTLNPLNLNATDQDGGTAGVNNVDTCELVDAQEGCPGTVFYNATIAEDTTRFVFRPVTVSAASPICEGDSTTIKISANGTPSVYIGTTALCVACISVVVAPILTTTYTIVVDYNDGGFDTSYVTVNVNAKPTLVIPDPPPFCIGDSIIVSAPSTFVEYAWSTGETSTSITINTAKTVRLDVEDSNGCRTFTEFQTHFLLRTSIDIEPASVSAPYIGACEHGQRICRDLEVVNISDSVVRITFASTQNNDVISVPLSQFPKVIPPSGTATIAVCAGSELPGEYTDTLTIVEVCGQKQREVTATILESAWFTRCAVRITSDGELESLVPAIDVNKAIVTDLLGRVVQTPFRHGCYLVRTPTWSGLLIY